jgi:hypothetical protein
MHSNPGVGGPYRGREDVRLMLVAQRALVAEGSILAMVGSAVAVLATAIVNTASRGRAPKRPQSN